MSLVPAIADGDRPAGTDGPTEAMAPVVASMENAEIVLSVAFVVYASSDSSHTMSTLVILVPAVMGLKQMI